MRIVLTLCLGASAALLGLVVLRDSWCQRRTRRLAECRAQRAAEIDQRIAELRARNQRFLDDLYAQQLVEEDVVFQTERGSMYGLTVHTQSPEQACEALVAKYLQPVKAA